MKRLVLSLLLLSAAIVSFSSKSKTAQCEAFSSAWQCPATAAPGSLYCTYHKSWENDGDVPIGILKEVFTNVSDTTPPKPKLCLYNPLGMQCPQPALPGKDYCQTHSVLEMKPPQDRK